MNKRGSLFHISKRDTLPLPKALAIRGGIILLALVFCGLIKSGINDLYIFALNCLFNIGYFLRPLVNQQNDQMHLRVIFLYRLGNFL